MVVRIKRPGRPVTVVGVQYCSKNKLKKEFDLPHSTGYTIVSNQHSLGEKDMFKNYSKEEQKRLQAKTDVFKVTKEGLVYAETIDDENADYIIGEDYADENKNLNCYNCENCYACSCCVDCVDCTGITHAGNCTDCHSCWDLHNCIGCEGCQNCSACKNLKNCFNSSYCYSCEYCFDCTNCDDCIGCKNCSGCASCHTCDNQNDSSNLYKVGYKEE